MKHGETVNYKYTRIYNSWRNMIQRTLNKNNTEFENYGGRGIAICNEWKIASNYIKWAKDNGFDNGLELDRIDNNGNYEPSNCHFVTRSENQINKRKRDDWGIYYLDKYLKYRIIVQRNKKQYSGYKYDLNSAREMRDELVELSNKGK